MQIRFFDQELLYDGSQLRCQYAYLEHGILGSSAIAWIGPCNITFENMADGEDLLQRAEIRGSKMLHFLIEIFDMKLIAAVAFQRLLATIVRDEILNLDPRLANQIHRDGDDLYWQNRKLSISVAAASPISSLIHFAVNIANQGTPVPTCALEEWTMSPVELADRVLRAFKKEVASSYEATFKVRPV